MNPPSSAHRRSPKSPEIVNPPALLKWMMQQWRPEARAPARTLPSARVRAHRRQLVSERFPADTLVIPTGHERVRSNDTHYRFRPGSDFFWLTGHLAPDAVLVLTPRRGGHRAHLFVEPNAGRANPTFYTDRHRGALWVGERPGIEESRARAGVDRAHPLDGLAAFLRGRPRTRLLRGISAKLDALVKPRGKGTRDAALASTLSELRLRKDRTEVSHLEAAIASTRRGFEDVILALPLAKSEREVEGRFTLRARLEGNDVGYGTIAASGANACVLHWTRNDGRLRSGDLLLVDAGVEGNHLYTADITRTLPISGTFSADQAEIYDLVWQAQQAAIAEVRPRAEFLAPHRAAMQVLTHGLVRLGVLKTSAEDALADEHQFYKRYTLHGTSHMLGLDVHDCARARNERYRYGKLEPGMVLTIEPGLYFQPDDLTVPRRFRGIGVRIEDDLLVTRRGARNLSADIPSERTAVEQWMARLTRRA
jgi:Xaa-Pro aminopeptidase